MIDATAFPPIVLDHVTDRPLVEILKKGPETPVLNDILRRKRRAVSQLRNTRWPLAATVEPDAPETVEPPQPAPAPDVTPEPETTPAPEPSPESIPESPTQE